MTDETANPIPDGAHGPGSQPAGHDVTETHLDLLEG